MRLWLILVVLFPSLALAQVTGTGSYVPAGDFQATFVPPTPTLLGIYDDDSVGSFEGVNAWLGRPVDFTSIHTGQASEYDFVNSVDYVLWSSRYAGVNAAGVADSRLVSVPLIWEGASLAAAAAGWYNGDYAIVAEKILNDIPAGPAPGQSIIYLRTGWEENLAGEMPWSSSGQEAQYIAAFQQFVTVFRSVDVARRFRFVWCPNVTGDPITWSYPGDDYVDVMSMDFYYGLSAPTDSPDPDLAFQGMLNSGLNQVAQMAASSGKGLAFSEWGVNQDNFGNYVKDFFDWCRAQGCLYVTYWNNDGGYPSKLSDGSYPETGAMFRHLWDPANYPVEPIAAPVGVAALAGNGFAEITSNPVRSSTPVTTYYLYKGSSSGQESTVPVATSSQPSFTDYQPNGRTAYYRVGAGNALSLGYLSAEVSATPLAPSIRPLPAAYLDLTSGGYASSSTSALTGIMQSAPALGNATITALLTSAPGPNMIAGFPNGLSIGLDANNNLLGYSRDFWDNRWIAVSTLPVPFPADGKTPEWVRVDFDAIGATTTFYVAPVNGRLMPQLNSPLWSQLGAQQIGQNHNGIFGNVEPFVVGVYPGSRAQVIGTVYDVGIFANGVLIDRAHFDNQNPGTQTYTDWLGKTWSLGGNASIN